MKAKPSKTQKRIERIKAELARLGEMRPGSLSKQYSVCGKKGCKCADPNNPKKHGPYYQLAYVHKGKQTTQFIRPPLVPVVRRQITTYKTFKKLVDEWIELALEDAKLKLDAARNELDK